MAGDRRSDRIGVPGWDAAQREAMPAIAWGACATVAGWHARALGPIARGTHVSSDSLRGNACSRAGLKSPR